MIACHGYSIGGTLHRHYIGYNAILLRQRLFNFFTLLSLLLFVIFSGLWLRSMTRFEQLSFWYARWPQGNEARTMHLSVAWYSTTLRVNVIHEHFPQVYFLGWPAGRMDGFRDSRPAGLRWVFMGEPETWALNGYPPGFAFRYGLYGQRPNPPGEQWVLQVRAWLPPLLSALLPGVWVYRRYKSRKDKRAGLCPVCGYDLRATPTRCPECGNVPVS